jgi:hypothetical protein
VRSHPIAVGILVGVAGLVFVIQSGLVVVNCVVRESGGPCHAIGTSTWSAIVPPLALILAVATAVRLRSPLAAGVLGFLWTAGLIVFDTLAFR